MTLTCTITALLQVLSAFYNIDRKVEKQDLKKLSFANDGNDCNRKDNSGWVWWVMPIIPAPWEA